jgi:hypothetical protein
MRPKRVDVYPFMQDRGYGLPGISLLGTWVNKGKKKKKGAAVCSSSGIAQSSSTDTLVFVGWHYKNEVFWDGFQRQHRG